MRAHANWTRDCRSTPAVTPHHQRGSMAVSLMLMMLGLISMLALIEVGYLYWAKRDTQKVADLASLAGAQQLNACASGNQDNSAARGNATTENGFNATLQITCGTWDPVANSGITDHFATTASGSTPNAVKVVAKRPVTPLFALTSTPPNVSTEAVASGLPPIAVFTVGSTLVTVNGASPLGQLLSSIGISVPNASLVGYNGLANVTITPSGLLNQLGVQVPANITVGGLNSLLAAQANAHALIDVLNAIVTAGGQQQLTSANANLVGAITTNLGTAPGTVTLGSTSGTQGGLFTQIVAPDAAAQSALNAQVNALQLISTAVGVATGKHAITLPNASINLPPITVSAAAAVIEPPAIGIGGVGTTAYTAQIRAYLDLNISTQNIPALGSLLGLLVNLTLDVPVAIDLVNAKATLTDLCDSTDSSGRSLATIAVNSSVLEMCVGHINQNSAFSTAGSCDQIPGASTNHLLLNASALSLLGAPINLANVNTHFVVSALPASGSATFYVGQTQNVPANGTPLSIGTALTNLLTTLTSVLSSNATTSSASNLASVINYLSPILQSALNAAGSSVLTPLLNTLGIDIGVSTVNLQYLRCHAVQLVY